MKELKDWKVGRVNDYQTHDRVWYKKFESTKPCDTNKFIQICVKEYVFPQHTSFQVELVAEDTGNWIELNYYAQPNLDKLDSLVESLIRKWEA